MAWTHPQDATNTDGVQGGATHVQQQTRGGSANGRAEDGDVGGTVQHGDAKDEVETVCRDDKDGQRAKMAC